MSGTIKKLQFAEGTSVTQPTDLTISEVINNVAQYANDAAFEAANPGFLEGAIYYNTTLDLIRMYRGTWVTVAYETVAQTLTSKTLDSPTVTGTLLLQNTTGAQPELHFSEDPDNGTNVVKIKAPATLGADVTLTLPDNDGDSGQALVTDGSGVLSWTTVATASNATGSTPGLTTSYDALVADNVHAVSSADYTVLDNDGYRLINVTTGASDRTITLPTAAANEGRQIVVKKVDNGAGRVLVDGEGSETIDGSASTVEIIIEEDAATFHCDGTGWHTYGRSTPVYANMSQLRLRGVNGYGSTNNKIRRFNNNDLDIGVGAVGADNGVTGFALTIVKNGIYAITYFDNFTVGAIMGLSLNSTELTTSIVGLSNPQHVLTMNTSNAGGEPVSVSWIGILSAGDVVRAHTDGTATGTAGRAAFAAYRIG